MKFCIHRGTREIGGNCVELESGGQRILLDLGLPLDGQEGDPALLPNVSGLTAPDPNLRAIVLSHGHRDHWGLIPQVAVPDIPIIMGEAVERIMRAAADFVPAPFAPVASQHLRNGRPLTVGPFCITPYLVDHSGFDAYALLIEADGRRLFYSGDLRAHGRKGKLFEEMIAHPLHGIDVMLLEGSSLGRLADGEQFQTEEKLEDDFVHRFTATEGLALVVCSAQNIDRIVTIYRAAKKTGRTLIVDAYAAEILRACGYSSISKPEAGWSNIAVFIPQAQRVALKCKGIAAIVANYRGFRVWPEQLRDMAPKSVFLFRSWMMKDLEKAEALAGARCIWSQWDGYLKAPAGQMLLSECAERDIRFEVLHTSGHASVIDLQRLAKALSPKRLVPIHTFERDRYPSLFANVEVADNGQWMDV